MRVLGFKLLNRKQIACVGQRLASRTAESRQLADEWPENEPVLDYLSNPHSSHRKELEKCLESFQDQTQDVPIIIRGKEFKTNRVKHQLVPFDHKRKLAQFYYATPELILDSINASHEARKTWDDVPISERINIFKRASELASGKYRQTLNAATMLGQAKTIKQAEIDSACELADFFSFNAHFMDYLSWQPRSTDSEHNSLIFRGLDGFVAAISPFNFTAIGGNLASAPALMGNCVVWKPSDTAMLSNYIVFKLLSEAGIPDGVINFVPSDGYDFGRLITNNNKLAGINFTGSLKTFQWLWTEVGLNIQKYDAFPRLVGECGGKNFHLIHMSADLEVATAQTIRSAFEYSGQKCSACSRLYVPANLWPAMSDRLASIVEKELKVGPATDFSSYTSAIIDANAFKRVTSYIKYAKAVQQDIELLAGGNSSDEVGYYVEPTIFVTRKLDNILMQEEIFGPILTVYVYRESELESILDHIGSHRFALTGSVFAQDEDFIEHAMRKLRMSAGNLYINDKSTGAVVGQQPFGGAKLSGTNDKAGGPHHLMRWCNQQTIKRSTGRLIGL